ncbi:hypothetical protein R6Q57_002072 [Mikania cordata]
MASIALKHGRPAIPARISSCKVGKERDKSCDKQELNAELISFTSSFGSSSSSPSSSSSSLENSMEASTPIYLRRSNGTRIFVPSPSRFLQDSSSST